MKPLGYAGLPNGIGQFTGVEMRLLPSFFHRSSTWAQPLLHVASQPLPLMGSAPPSPLREAVRGDEKRDSALQGTLDAMRLGALPLCSTQQPPQAPALGLHEVVASLGRQGEASSSSAPPLSPMDERLRQGESGALREFSLHVHAMAEDASAAAVSSRDGAMASLLAHGGEQAAPSLAADLGKARARVEQWQCSLEAGFGPMGLAEDEVVTQLHSQLRSAGTSLSRIEGDLARCQVDADIQAHKLPPETSVLGEIAALRDWDSQAFDLDHADSRDLPALASLAEGLCERIDAFGDTLGSDQLESMRSMARQGVDVAALLSSAIHSVTAMAAACPDSQAKATLEKLCTVLLAASEKLSQPVHALQAHRPSLLAPAPPLQPSVPGHTLDRARDFPAEAASVTAALSQLWGLRPDNDAIVDRMSQILPGRMQSQTRIELVRVALNFLDPGNARFASARRRLCKLALDTPGASSSDLRHIAGEDVLERQKALEARLLEVTQVMPPASQNALIHHLLPAEFVWTASEANTRQLPADTGWLKKGAERKQLIERYPSLGPTAQRKLVREMAVLASDLTALRGSRHQLLHVARRLMRSDLGDTPPPQFSSDWYSVVSALVAQMTDEAMGDKAGDMLTRNGVLELASQYIDDKRMSDRHRARLALELQPMIRHMSTGRWNPVKDGQGRALSTLEKILPCLPSRELGPVLLQMLQERRHWSAENRPSGKLPGTHKQFKMLANRLGMLTVYGPIGWIEPLVPLAGRGLASKGSSPQDKAREMALDQLERRMTEQSDTLVAKNLLPVCREWLKEFQAADEPLRPEDVRALEKTISSLVKGGLPQGLSQQDRDRFLLLGLGDDRESRQGVAQALTAICKKEGPGDDRHLRVCAARYLQNLIASDKEGMDPGVVEEAKSAVSKAVDKRALSGSRPETLRVANAMYDEALRDGAEVPDALRQNILLRTMEGLTAPSGQAEIPSLISRSVSCYGGMSANERQRFKMAFDRQLPYPPRAGNVVAEQTIAVGWFKGLINFRGPSEQRPHEGRALLQDIEKFSAHLWNRMNGTHQSAALYGFFTDYAQGCESGQAAMRAFYSKLRGDQFISASVQLVGDVLADPSARQALNGATWNATLSALLGGLEKAQPRQIADLAANTLSDAEEWPVALAQTFLEKDSDLSIAARHAAVSRLVAALPGLQGDGFASASVQLVRSLTVVREKLEDQRRPANQRLSAEQCPPADQLALEAMEKTLHAVLPVLRESLEKARPDQVSGRAAFPQ